MTVTLHSPDVRADSRPVVTRRGFLRGSLIGATIGGLGTLAAGSIGFLWPSLGAGFGAAIPLGSAAAIAQQIGDARAPLEAPAGRLYVVRWDPTIPGAQDRYGEHQVTLADGTGLMALYQKCPHLGCRVPWCQSSQWFECPCHGSKYNRWGEWMSGPAPRGMDRFPTQIDADGILVANTGTIITGPARTARVLQQEPEGPHCVDI